MRISDWSSDVCSSDLGADHPIGGLDVEVEGEVEIGFLGGQDRAGVDEAGAIEQDVDAADLGREGVDRRAVEQVHHPRLAALDAGERVGVDVDRDRSEERGVGKEGVSTGRTWGSAYQ